MIKITSDHVQVDKHPAVAFKMQRPALNDSYATYLGHLETQTALIDGGRPGPDGKAISNRAMGWSTLIEMISHFPLDQAVKNALTTPFGESTSGGKATTWHDKALMLLSIADALKTTTASEQREDLLLALDQLSQEILARINSIGVEGVSNTTTGSSKEDAFSLLRALSIILLPTLEGLSTGTNAALKSTVAEISQDSEARKIDNLYLLKKMMRGSVGVYARYPTGHSIVPDVVQMHRTREAVMKFTTNAMAAIVNLEQQHPGVVKRGSKFAYTPTGRVAETRTLSNIFQAAECLSENIERAIDLTGGGSNVSSEGLHALSYLRQDLYPQGVVESDGSLKLELQRHLEEVYKYFIDILVKNNIKLPDLQVAEKQPEIPKVVVVPEPALKPAEQPVPHIEVNITIDKRKTTTVDVSQTKTTEEAAQKAAEAAQKAEADRKAAEAAQKAAEAAQKAEADRKAAEAAQKVKADREAEEAKHKAEKAEADRQKAEADAKKAEADKKAAEDAKKAAQKPKIPRDIPTIWAADIGKLPQDQKFNLSAARRAAVFYNTRNFELAAIFEHLKDKSPSDKLMDHLQPVKPGSGDLTPNDELCLSSTLKDMTVQQFRDFCHRTDIANDTNAIHKFDNAIGNTCKAYSDRMQTERKNAFAKLAQQSSGGAPLGQLASALRPLAATIDDALSSKELIEDLKQQLFAEGKGFNLEGEDPSKIKYFQQWSSKIIDNAASTLIGIAKYKNSAPSENEVEEALNKAKREIRELDPEKIKITDEELNSVISSLKHLYHLNLEAATIYGVNSFSEMATERLAKICGTPGCLDGLSPAERLMKAIEVTSKSDKMKGTTVSVDENGGMKIVISQVDKIENKSQYQIDKEIAEKFVASMLVMMLTLKPGQKIEMFYTDNHNKIIRTPLLNEVIKQMKENGLDPGILEFQNKKIGSRSGIFGTVADIWYSARNRTTHLSTHSALPSATGEDSKYLEYKHDLIDGLSSHLKEICETQHLTEDKKSFAILNKEINLYLKENVGSAGIHGAWYSMGDKGALLRDLADRVSNARSGWQDTVRKFMIKEYPNSCNSVQKSTAYPYNTRANAAVSGVNSGIANSSRKATAVSEVSEQEQPPEEEPPHQSVGVT